MRLPVVMPSRCYAKLQALEVVELGELASWLANADGNWPLELLTESMGKIGGYTTSELEAFAADISYDVHIRSNAANALVERVQKCPDQREQIVDFMRMLLTRPEADETATEETFIGFLIDDILDLKAKELYPEIEASYQEDRVDTSIVGLESVQEEFVNPLPLSPNRRDDGLYLRLRCIECGRERSILSSM